MPVHNPNPKHAVMTAQEIRSTFLAYFEAQAHQIVPSAPIVVKDDPTLLFVNAGMNPFKDFFLGTKTPQHRRVADTQKCLRVSGKHNDLEEVGLDTYHHTLFEMLGNWSFGDYFKAEAITWAWELLTEKYKLNKNDLYATVFGGDKADKLGEDSEARELWKQFLPDAQILSAGKKDNFWEMGDTGPCGPCSELHVDLRSEEEKAKIPGRDLVNKDHPQVVEIWNLVFIQFERKKDGSLHELPAKHIDTGMGLERLVMALQGKKSNYDTDVFQPLIQFVAKKAGINYYEFDHPEAEANEKTNIALRVIADHVRAIAFTIADGELPANTGAGYVIKRILRRAVRYGYTFLNFREPFLYELVEILAQQFAEVFPEIVQQKDFIQKVIFEEENAFLRTLEKGLKRFEQLSEGLEKGAIIAGQEVFELYDTYGFPVDLTALIARENGFEIDEKGFETAMQAQKDRSRQAAEQDKDDWAILRESDSDFVGYDQLRVSETRIVRYRKIQEKKKAYFQVVLDQTPFYAESGGQVGDKGILIAEDGKKYPVFDTKKENDLTVHLLKELPADPSGVFVAEVNTNKRQLAACNHSATHLLHSALREVLGDHVAQKGSLVSDEVLRFDFSHFSKMEDEEILKVERRVNEKIRENIALQEERNLPLAEAKARGAMALFGEKYGDSVRVITFDPKYSVELCGGTHVKATGEIGLFKITSESSVAAGVRRIEALTAIRAEEFVGEQQQLVQNLKAELKAKDLRKGIEQLLKEKNKLAKAVEALENQATAQLKAQLLSQKKEVGEATQIIAQVQAPSADALKQLAFQLRQEVPNLFLVLGAEVGGKPQLAVMLADSLVERGLDAGQLIRQIAKHIKGGGGGQKFFATAGGKDISGIPAALKAAESALAEA